MKGRKMRRSKAILSMLLAAALVMEPLGASAIVHAEEGDEATVQTEKEVEESKEDSDQPEQQPDSEAGEEQGGDDVVKDEESGEPKEEETPKDEDASEDGEKVPTDEEKGEENPDDGNGQEETDEQQPVEGDEADDDQTDENDGENEPVEEEDEKEKESVSENNSVSENDLDEGQDENLEGFTEMPDDYRLTSAQMASKRELAGYMDEILEMDEGSDYAEGELVLLADSEEEAEQIAEAYHAEIKKFEYGVLTLKLSKGDSVVKAMRVAANADVNLPAAWPNYYIYAFGEESAEISVESDELIEVETTEYELNALGVGSLGESNELSYRAAYTDEYLSSDKVQYQYHHTVIGSPYAWAAGYTGSGIKVAVLDTGIGSNTDLPFVTEVGNNATRDVSGHGTHVAGIIAAKADGKYGVGVAPEASLYASNVLPNDDGSGNIDDVMAALNAVSGQSGSNITVDVVNMSLGGFGYNADYQKIITGAYKNGVAIFAAAGNDGGNNYNYPACYDHVVSIAATDQSNARASFSNYNNKVDLSAPGVAIYSTDAFEGLTDDYGIQHTTYIDMSGTSMACPVAAGEAAVILSADPAALQGKTGGDKVDALCKLMQDNATKVSGSGMGKGITNLAKALNINTVNEKPTVPNIEIEADGALQKVTVTMTAQFGAEIYYTDNGKNPVYKNGAPDDNTKKYTASFDITDRAKCDIRAIAVNGVGDCSKVVKKVYTLKPYVTNITVSGVDQVAKGKSVQLSAVVEPLYAAKKTVTWEIYTAGADGKQPGEKIDKNSDKTLKTGVSISNKGKVAAAKTAKTGTYVVKVTANDGKAGEHEAFSTTYPVTVTEAAKINSVKFGKKSLTLAVPAAKTCDLKTEAQFEAKQKDSAGSLTDAAASDFKWSSSKTAVATVDADGVVTPHKAGKAVITALANDSSGKKATCTITVQQLAIKMTVTGSSVIGKSKSNTYKAVIEPTDVTNKKVTWSLSEKDGNQWKEVDGTRAKTLGVSINANNGKVSTTKNAVLGEYLVKAVTKDAAAVSAEKIVTVKDGLITKFTVKPVASTIYRKTNAFDAVTTTKVNVTVTGSGSADLTAYEIISSDVKGNIVTVGNDTKNENGTSEFTVTATGRAAGKVTLTVKATDGSNKSAKCTINVNNPITGIRIAPSGSNNEYVAKGKSLQLKAILETGSGKVSNKNVEWQLLTNEVTPQLITKETDKTLKTGMSISAKGKVSAAKNAKDGWYIVRVISKDKSAAAVFPIRVAAPATMLSIRGMSSNALNIGDEGGGYGLPIISDIRQGGFSFSSSNPAVASVGLDGRDPTGMTMYLACCKKGNAVITIKALDGSGKSVKYRVKVE